MFNASLPQETTDTTAAPHVAALDNQRAVQAAGPVQPQQRIQTIDILRGFAIFGILLVNMEFYHQAALNLVAQMKAPATMLDQLARWFIAFFGEGKFYSTFSFLFGLGMAIQYSRAEARHARFGPFWLRRMLVLLAFGLIHAYLVWPGDILILYSLLGIALLLWRKARPRTLLIWAAVFLLLPLLLNGALFGLTLFARLSPGGEEMIAQLFAEQAANYRLLAAEADRIYATGSFFAVTAQRVRDMNLVYTTWPFIAFNVLAMMLLGIYTGKRRIFTDIPGNLPFIRKVWLWGLILGVFGNFLYVYFGHVSSRSIPSPQLLISLVGQTFGAPALAFFYMATLTLLAERAAWRRRLTPLSFVGRMALTNYLAQSLICTLLFYGYGLGLYYQIGIAGGIALALAIYAVEIGWSVWWLRRFRFGPIEWLWRTLTYGRRQPMTVDLG